MEKENNDSYEGNQSPDAGRGRETQEAVTSFRDEIFTSWQRSGNGNSEPDGFHDSKQPQARESEVNPLGAQLSGNSGDKPSELNSQWGPHKENTAGQLLPTDNRTENASANMPEDLSGVQAASPEDYKDQKPIEPSKEEKETPLDDKNKSEEPFDSSTEEKENSKETKEKQLDVPPKNTNPVNPPKEERPLNDSYKDERPFKPKREEKPLNDSHRDNRIIVTSKNNDLPNLTIVY